MPCGGWPFPPAFGAAARPRQRRLEPQLQHAGHHGAHTYCQARPGIDRQLNLEMVLDSIRVLPRGPAAGPCGSDVAFGAVAAAQQQDAAMAWR